MLCIGESAMNVISINFLPVAGIIVNVLFFANAIYLLFRTNKMMPSHFREHYSFLTRIMSVIIIGYARRNLCESDADAMEMMNRVVIRNMKMVLLIFLFFVLYVCVVLVVELYELYDL